MDFRSFLLGSRSDLQSSGFGCNHWRGPGFDVLYAALNPEYRSQTPMFEGVRTDELRGPFGFQMQNALNTDHAWDQVAHDASVPYGTLADASGTHGLVFEQMGFFVPPFTAHYSFHVWGTEKGDLWMSTSDDPADTVKVAETLWGGQCRRGATELGCSLVVDRNHPARSERHQIGTGARVAGSYGFSGDPEAGAGFVASTLRTLSLQQGERRWFVRRSRFQEEPDRDGHSPRRRAAANAYESSHRRRRRFLEGAAVRIHRPSLSGLTPEARGMLAKYKSWPEVVRIVRRAPSGVGRGSWTFRLGLRDQLADGGTEALHASSTYVSHLSYLGRGHFPCAVLQPQRGISMHRYLQHHPFVAARTAVLWPAAQRARK